VKDRFGPEALARLRAVWERPAVRRVRDRVEIALGLAAAGYLAWKLSQIGWREVLAALPGSPLFYALLVPRLLAVPLAETVVYRRLWDRPMLRHWPVFLRKTAYNFGFLEYTGEVYFAAWVPKALKLPAKRALAVIKDVNVLSAFLGNIAAVAMFGALMLSGQAGRLLAEAPQVGAYLAVAGLFVLAITGVGLVLGRRLIGLPRRDVAFVCAVHAARILGQMLLQAAQWAIAIPSASVGVWLVFLTTNMAITRIPLIPGRELVFAGVGLALIGMVDAPEAKVAATLAASTALMQAGYFAMLLAGWCKPRRKAPA
jgi:hypothetical protein